MISCQQKQWRDFVGDDDFLFFSFLFFFLGAGYLPVRVIYWNFFLVIAKIYRCRLSAAWVNGRKLRYLIPFVLCKKKLGYEILPYSIRGSTVCRCNIIHINNDFFSYLVAPKEPVGQLFWDAWQSQENPIYSLRCFYQLIIMLREQSQSSEYLWCISGKLFLSPLVAKISTLWLSWADLGPFYSWMKLD